MFIIVIILINIVVRIEIKIVLFLEHVKYFAPRNSYHTHVSKKYSFTCYNKYSLLSPTLMPSFIFVYTYDELIFLREHNMLF